MIGQILTELPKLELFGAAKLPKTMTLEDLDEDDLEVFKTGSYIILPKKDRSGRQPQLLNLPRLKFKDWRNQVRNRSSIQTHSGKAVLTPHLTLPSRF